MKSFEEHIEEANLGTYQPGRTVGRPFPAGSVPTPEPTEDQKNRREATAAGFDTVEEYLADKAQKEARVKELQGRYTEYEPDPRGPAYDKPKTPEQIARDEAKAGMEYFNKDWTRHKLIKPDPARGIEPSVGDKSQLGNMANNFISSQMVKKTLEALIKSEPPIDWQLPVSVTGIVSLGGKSIGMTGDVRQVQSVKANTGLPGETVGDGSGWFDHVAALPKPPGT